MEGKMAKSRRNIKTGGGADIISPVYASFGRLSKRPSGLGRAKPIRGERQRSRGR
jgi:hypothetical protein